MEARLGNLSAAREHLRRALELEPNLEAARRALADLGSD
ncbi:MAG: tetratricopeptide repeat protein [Desulfarculus sp.]|nr:tetratricopeptide repeat protein [Desulfarculus sp.]